MKITMESNMKTKIFIGVLIAVLLLSAPAPSHALGLLRYIFDAVANQLGLDRGPIPKIVPKATPHDCGPVCPLASRYPGTHQLYIQAEGF